MFNEGKWVTVHGRHVFIGDDEDLETAMKKSGKFDSSKQKDKDTAKIKNPGSKNKSKSEDEQEKERQKERDARRASAAADTRSKAKHLKAIQSGEFTTNDFMNLNYTQLQKLKAGDLTAVAKKLKLSKDDVELFEMKNKSDKIEFLRKKIRNSK